MNIDRLALSVAALALTSVSLLAAQSSTLAQHRTSRDCIPLKLVGGEGSEVSKTVSQPTVPSPIPGVQLTQDNWNTDWAVPTERRFRNFIATIASDDGGTFDIKYYVKYNDQTADLFFDNNGVEIKPNKPLVLTAQPRAKADPYQINLFVGGLDRIGGSYRASVKACS